MTIGVLLRQLAVDSLAKLGCCVVDDHRLASRIFLSLWLRRLFVDLQDDLRVLEASTSIDVRRWRDFANLSQVVVNISLLHFHFVSCALGQRNFVVSNLGALLIDI